MEKRRQHHKPPGHIAGPRKRGDTVGHPHRDIEIGAGGEVRSVLLDRTAHDQSDHLAALRLDLLPGHISPTPQIITQKNHLSLIPSLMGIIPYSPVSVSSEIPLSEPFE
ncbi:hypothetical protein SDC9_144746 [bioreactor metagenome]|uniref:Uncharacterized protein n=1 Tax=bioreactor metagenome TaxID=1076179 RepID=A0A645E816_9ZZZZ